MPIYEYRCSACGFEKDALQKMADAPLVDCPECGKPNLVKLVSAAGFHLKGSGWYATDFKESGKAKPADKPKSDAAAPAAAGAAPVGDAGGAKTADSTTTATKTSKPAAPSTSTTPTTGAGD